MGKDKINGRYPVNITNSPPISISSSSPMSIKRTGLARTNARNRRFRMRKTALMLPAGRLQARQLGTWYRRSDRSHHSLARQRPQAVSPNHPCLHYPSSHFLFVLALAPFWSCGMITVVIDVVGGGRGGRAWLNHRGTLRDK